MQQRLQYATVSPDGYKAFGSVRAYIAKCGLEESLINLVYLRVSQINGCAYCVDMHTRDAEKAGESTRRLHNVITWHETPLFSERERAALAWAEAVTLVADGHVPDDVFEKAHRHFNDDELASLTLGIVAINGWNRLSIAFRTTPGTHQPAAKEEHRAAA